MDWQFKKIFSVLFAILVGIGVVLFAWKGGDISSVKNTLYDTAWEDSLSVVPQIDQLKTISASRSGETESVATTTVDIVARELLTNYTLAQKNMSTTTLSDADAQAIAQMAVNKIDLPKAKQFAIKDLNISNNNSPESLATYMKEVGVLTQAFTMSQTKNDIEVAFAVPKIVSDTKREADIAQNIAHYEKLIDGLLAIKTPSLISSLHVRLLQKYANIQATIKPMADIFVDPIKGLVALAEYRAEISGFNSLAKDYEIYISKAQ